MKKKKIRCEQKLRFIYEFDNTKRPDQIEAGLGPMICMYPNNLFHIGHRVIDNRCYYEVSLNGPAVAKLLPKKVKAAFLVSGAFTISSGGTSLIHYTNGIPPRQFYSIGEPHSNTRIILTTHNLIFIANVTESHLNKKVHEKLDISITISYTRVKKK